MFIVEITETLKRVSKLIYKVNNFTQNVKKYPGSQCFIEVTAVHKIIDHNEHDDDDGSEHTMERQSPKLTSFKNRFIVQMTSSN